MTVKELIEELSRFPSDATVKVQPDWFRISITDVHHDAMDNEVIIG